MANLYRATSNIDIHTSDEVQVTGYLYKFGFDNIKAFYTEYRSRGIYVSPVLKVGKPGLIMLKAQEVKPTVEIGGTDVVPFTFEYTLFKRNFASSGELIDEEVIPVLPLADLESISERLFLKEAIGSAGNNVTYFRFIPTVTVATGTAPVIKQDHSTLSIGTDYTVKARGGDDWRSTWAAVETDIKTGTYATNYKLNVAVKFTNPNARSFYTADYIVSTSTGTTNYRWISEWVKMQQNGFLRCESDRGSGKEIASAHLYLIVLMRRNYIASDLTASLEEYKLLVSTYNNEQ